MRKKLLSLLTVLCLVLGMLPATAMAAGIAADLGYSEDEIAMYVSEDTELTEDVDGLVLVVAPVTVTVKGASLTSGLVVAPDAAGAKVTLDEGANVNAVVVMAAAEVTVAETATAATVTVSASESTVTIAGEVKAVNVAAEAEKATVTVAETAKVETVEVAAPAAAVKVEGEVKTVTVAETAAGAAVTVAETATVAALEVAAPEVKAEVAGTVESVKVAETATGAELAVAGTAKVAEVTDATGELAVSGDGAANVTVTDTTTTPAGDDKKDEETSGETNEGTEQSPRPNTPVIDDTESAPAAAPQGKLTTAPIGEENAKNYKLTISDMTTKYAGDADAVYNVKIHAEEVKQTTNPSGVTANWVGIGIPISADGNYAYKYYTLTRWRSDATPDDMHAAVFTGKDGDTTVSNLITSTSLEQGALDWTENGTVYHGVYVPAGESYPAAVLWSVGVEVYDISSKIATSETLSMSDLEGLVPVWTEIYDIEVEITEAGSGSNAASLSEAEEEPQETGEPKDGEDADTTTEDTETAGDTEFSEGGEDVPAPEEPEAAEAAPAGEQPAAA